MADDIQSREIETATGALGLVHHVSGDAASPIQFFVTDTVNHFVRAALYSNSQPNADSLAEVFNFIETDIEQIIGSLEWVEQ